MAQVFFLGPATDSQMFGMILQTANKTVVIDGGTEGDSDQLAELLRNHCYGKVDAWFFTHPHQDHIGAFCTLRKNAPDIQIGTIYHCFPSNKNLNAGIGCKRTYYWQRRHPNNNHLIH